MSKNIVPEAIRSFGSPWLVGGLPGSCRIGPAAWPFPGMGQFLIQTTGSSILVTFPYQASLERGATMVGTEDWLMGLPPGAFNHFATTSLKAVMLNENSVVWIPYGWVTMLVNFKAQSSIPQALLVPYLNAKLAFRYPSLGLLVNFHVENVKASQMNKGRFWTDQGDSYLEWLATILRRDGSSNASEVTEVMNSCQPALMDGKVDEGESQPKDSITDSQVTDGGN